MTNAVEAHLAGNFFLVLVVTNRWPKFNRIITRLKNSNHKVTLFLFIVLYHYEASILFCRFLKCIQKNENGLESVWIWNIKAVPKKSQKEEICTARTRQNSIRYTDCVAINTAKMYGNTATHIFSCNSVDSNLKKWVLTNLIHSSGRTNLYRKFNYR